MSKREPFRVRTPIIKNLSIEERHTVVGAWGFEPQTH
jgi:hypothetical protein